MGEGQPIFNEYELPALSHPDLTTRVLTFSWYAVINAGLLLFPLNQSSDWSYGSIPLVQTVADPRFVSIALFYVLVVCGHLSRGLTLIFLGTSAGARPRPANHYD